MVYSADITTHIQLLVALKYKGAAPWLLEQLRKERHTGADNNLAHKCLSDTKALKSINTQAKQLNSVSSIYGQVTTDRKWESPKAWTAGLSSAQFETLQSSATPSGVLSLSKVLPCQDGRMTLRNDMLVKTLESNAHIREMESKGWTLVHQAAGEDSMTSLAFERNEK